LDLADEQLFSAIGLLDRYAAASPAPIAAGPGAFALVLAVMLVALKVSGFKKDLERARRLVVEVSGSSRPWAAVRKAELSILRRLGFRACTPTAFDLLDRLLSDLFPTVVTRLSIPGASSGDSLWDHDTKLRCSNLARFLLEMCVVYDPEALYGSGRSPLVSAVASVLLSLLAHAAPRQYAQMLGEAVHLTESNRTSLTEIAEAMRNRWVVEEQKNASVVLEKWRRRSGIFEVSPPTSCDLRALTAGIAIAMPTKADQPRSYAPAKARLSEMLPSVPTPARRAGPREVGGSSSKNPLGPGQHGLPAPRLSQKTSTEKEEPHKKQPGQKQQEEEIRQQENHRPPRLSAPEQLAFWPMPAAPVATVAPPVPAAPPAAPANGLGSMATGANERPVADEPEPLLELTHVLNMVAPRPQIPPSGGCLTKLQAPSVAAELLVSSALRMHWPTDKRKLARKDAASTCREAAGVLQEAINQLSAAAEVFESGGSNLREVVKAHGTETKRRRTYAGSALPGAISPPLGGDSVLSSSMARAPAVYRGSPPVVRTRPLRV